MNSHYIKHNVIIFLCTILMINGCNNQNKKIIVTNYETIQTTKNLNIINPTAKFPNQNVTDKILKKELLSDDNNESNKLSDNNNVVFEFRNERLLQGRNINNLEDKKTKLALSAVQKMFKN